LKRYADQLESKVIAFQEVENKAAAERVFDPALYDIFIPQPSKPRDELCKEDPSRHIRPKLVGFAIRKGVDYKTEEPLKGLDIGRDGRWGAIITVVASPVQLRCTFWPCTSNSAVIQIRLIQIAPTKRAEFSVNSSKFSRAGLQRRLRLASVSFCSEISIGYSIAGQTCFGLL
jgi:hypothetical protein